MKILYLANIRLPTEKAHGIQIVKTCEALAKAGAEVELGVTDRHTPIAEDAFSYYAVATRFVLTRLSVLDTVGWGRFGFYLETWSFVRAAGKLLSQRTPDVVFSRDEQVLARVRTNARVVWETHTGSWSSAAQKVAARAHTIIAISQGLKEFYVAQGVPADKIVVVHDGVDYEQFALGISKEEARRALGIAPTKPLVVYTGSQYARKGVATLRAAADLLPNVELMVVSNKPHKEIPMYLRAADVLVLPNTATDIISARFTSPMKLFEYMASGVPLVASDIPSLREVLTESMAYFAKPDNPKSFAEVIQAALVDPAAPARAQRARAAAAAYSWDARARALIAAL